MSFQSDNNNEILVAKTQDLENWKQLVSMRKLKTKDRILYQCVGC